MAAEPSITINGRVLAKHHAWVVRQAVILLAAQAKNFADLGADGPVVQDVIWMTADVLKMMSSSGAEQSATVD